jgi:RNA polymerase sigma-70 factor (ECF subfamily)
MADASFAARLAAAQAGERWGVEALWRELHPRLLRFLRGLDAEHAEDLESETWLRAARDLGGFAGGEAEFRAWLFAIARHRCIDARRYRNRRPADLVADETLHLVAGTENPAQDVEDASGLEAVLAVVRTLAPEQAEVILLRVVGGLDVAQVAKIMNLRPGTIRVLQHRALRRLAERLEARSAVELGKL